MSRNWSVQLWSRIRAEFMRVVKQDINRIRSATSSLSYTWTYLKVVYLNRIRMRHRGRGYSILNWDPWLLYFYGVPNVYICHFYVCHSTVFGRMGLRVWLCKNVWFHMDVFPWGPSDACFVYLWLDEWLMNWRLCPIFFQDSLKGWHCIFYVYIYFTYILT